MLVTLADLKIGQYAKVIEIKSKGALKRHLLDMGVTSGADVVIRRTAPFGDPLQLTLRGYSLSMRKQEAKEVLVEPLKGGIQA